jgi:hypothetical protein
VKAFAILMTAGLVTIAVAAPAVAGAVAVGTALVTVGVLLAMALGDQREPIVQPLEPFGPDTDDALPIIETPDLTELLREIGSSNKDVPPRITAQLRDIAGGRLLDAHRIDIADPADHSRVDALVSDALASIALVDDERALPRIPKRRLGALLDELEKL